MKLSEKDLDKLTENIKVIIKDFLTELELEKGNTELDKEAKLGNSPKIYNDKVNLESKDSSKLTNSVYGKLKDKTFRFNLSPGDMDFF